MLLGLVKIFAHWLTEIQVREAMSGLVLIVKDMHSDALMMEVNRRAA